MSIVPTNFRPWLRRAGWSEGRRVVVDERVPTDHPAFALLNELNLIKFEDRERSIALLEFQYVEEAAQEARAWTSSYGLRLAGVADLHNAHGEAYMTERGHFVGISLIHDACWFLGGTLEDAMNALWSGRRCRPMLLPGQECVCLYGEDFHRSDPRMILPGTRLLD